MRQIRLLTWLTLIGLSFALLIVNLGAPILSHADEQVALKFQPPRTEIRAQKNFEITLDVQPPLGKDYQIEVPEGLDVNLKRTLRVNKAQLKNLDFDQQQRHLELTFHERTAPFSIKLWFRADKAGQVKLKASGQIPLPQPTQTEASSKESATSESAAVDLPIEYRGYQAPELVLEIQAESTPEKSTEESINKDADTDVTEESAAESSGSKEKPATAPDATEKNGQTNQSTESRSSKADSSAKSTVVSSGKTDTTEKESSDTKASQSSESSSAKSKSSIKAVAPSSKSDKTVTKKSVTLAATTTVNDYADLKAAYADPVVTTIKLAKDITAPTGLNGNDLGLRTTSLTIDGDNHELDLGVVNFRTGTTTGTQTMRVQNFKRIRAAATAGVAASSGSYGIIQNGGDSAGLAGSKWIAQFADLTTDDTVLRLASVAGNQVEIYGTVNATTVQETAVTSGVKVAENAKLTSRKAKTNGENRSFFWFTSGTPIGVGDRRFVIGDGAEVDCEGAPADTIYPVVYLNYEELNVGRGAKFTAKMYGYAYHAQQTSNTFMAQENSIVTIENMRVNGNQSAIQFSPGAGSANFTVKPGAEFYVTNRSRAPVFDGTLTSVKILLDAPKKYDIQNTSSGLTALLASIVRPTINSFRINKANLSMWSVTLPISVNAKATYQNVDWVEQNLAVVTSSHGSLLTALFSFSVSRRINNTLSIPTAEFSSPYAEDLGKDLVTDADKKVRLRVIMGYKESGETPVPIYADAGDATVKLTDDQGVEHTATTEQNGYVNFNLGRFLVAGKELKAAVTTSFTADPVSIIVQDKTPPAPVKVTNDRVVADQTQLSGSNAAAGNVRYTVNGAPALNGQNEEITDTVTDAGHWQMTRVTPTWVAGDQLQLLIKDAAGNENPTVQTTYHDATFAPGTKYTVAPANGPTPPTTPEVPGSGPATNPENPGTGNTGELRLDYAPSRFDFGTVVTSMQSKTYRAQTNTSKQWLQVSDNRLSQTGWSVKVKQNQQFTSDDGKTLTGAELKLPAGKTYNQRTSTGLTSHALSLTTTDQTIFGADGSAGNGKELSTNVWSPTDVQLSLPGNTAINGKSYQTTVSWTLTAEVAN